jgi:hypothetical protein
MSGPVELTLTHEHAVEEPKVSALLLTRTAYAGFDGVFNISSKSWRCRLDEIDRESQAFEHRRRVLLDILEQRIITLDKPERHIAIQIRRLIFNRLPLPVKQWEQLPQELALLVNEYCRHSTEIDLLIDGSVESVVAEFRHELTQLLLNETFVTAVNYSCPWLLKKIEDGASPTHTFSNAERGLYSYAVKMFAKANPFFVFAQVVLPSERSDMIDEPQCEIVLDSSLLSAIESQSLAGEGFTPESLIAIAPHSITNGRLKCIVASLSAFKILSIRMTPILELLVRYFEKPLGYHTIGEAIDYVLATRLEIATRTDVEQHIQKLLELSVFTRYCFRNLDSLSADLNNVAPEFRTLVSALSDVHLSTTPLSRVPDLHKKITSVVRNQLSAEAPVHLYYVNTFRFANLRAEQEIVKGLSEDLALLKGVFCVTNFSEESARIERWLKAYLVDRPHRSAPYLEAVEEFLRTPEVHTDGVRNHGGSRGLLARVQNIFSSYNGILTSTEVSQLGAALSQVVSGSAPSEDLCVTGNYDSSTDSFYVTNALVNHRRYMSRLRFYDWSRDIQETELRDRSRVEVQLLTPFGHNRDYGTPLYEVALSFRSRESREFKTWLSLGQVLIEYTDGQIRYRDGRSNRQIGVHYCGLGLANFLPAIYKLLLVGHGDYCYIPSGQVPHKSRSLDVEYEDGLYVGRLCIRRPQWTIKASVLDEVLASSNLLRAVLSLRTLLRRWTGDGDNSAWYYRTSRPGEITSKPRLLLSDNPLSIHSFRRDLRRMDNEGNIVLTKMAPGSSLRNSSEQHRATELFISL